MTELTGMVGFASPIAAKTLSRQRRLGIELFATVALAASVLIAATAVSLAMAHTQIRHDQIHYGMGSSVTLAIRP
jgi:hypothetical protein